MNSTSVSSAPCAFTPPQIYKYGIAKLRLCIMGHGVGGLPMPKTDSGFGRKGTEARIW